MICYGPDSLNCISFVQKELSIIKNKGEILWLMMFICMFLKHPLEITLFGKSSEALGDALLKVKRVLLFERHVPKGLAGRRCIIAAISPVLCMFKMFATGLQFNEPPFWNTLNSF